MKDDSGVALPGTWRFTPGVEGSAAGLATAVASSTDSTRRVALAYDPGNAGANASGADEAAGWSVSSDEGLARAAEDWRARLVRTRLAAFAAASHKLEAVAAQWPTTSQEQQAQLASATREALQCVMVLWQGSVRGHHLRFQPSCFKAMAKLVAVAGDPTACAIAALLATLTGHSANTDAVLKANVVHGLVAGVRGRSSGAPVQSLGLAALQPTEAALAEYTASNGGYLSHVARFLVLLAQSGRGEAVCTPEGVGLVVGVATAPLASPLAVELAVQALHIACRCGGRTAALACAQHMSSGGGLQTLQRASVIHSGTTTHGRPLQLLAGVVASLGSAACGAARHRDVLSMLLRLHAWAVQQYGGWNCDVEGGRRAEAALMRHIAAGVWAHAAASAALTADSVIACNLDIDNPHLTQGVSDGLEMARLEAASAAAAAAAAAAATASAAAAAAAATAAEAAAVEPGIQVEANAAPGTADAKTTASDVEQGGTHALTTAASDARVAVPELRLPADEDALLRAMAPALYAARHRDQRVAHRGLGSLAWLIGDHVGVRCALHNKLLAAALRFVDVSAVGGSETKQGEHGRARTSSMSSRCSGSSIAASRDAVEVPLSFLQTLVSHADETQIQQVCSVWFACGKLCGVSSVTRRAGVLPGVGQRVRAVPPSVAAELRLYLDTLQPCSPSSRRVCSCGYTRWESRPHGYGCLGQRRVALPGCVHAQVLTVCPPKPHVLPRLYDAWCMCRYSALLVWSLGRADGMQDELGTRGCISSLVDWLAVLLVRYLRRGTAVHALASAMANATLLGTAAVSPTTAGPDGGSLDVVPRPTTPRSRATLLGSLPGAVCGQLGPNSERDTLLRHVVAALWMLVADHPVNATLLARRWGVDLLVAVLALSDLRCVNPLAAPSSHYDLRR